MSTPHRHRHHHHHHTTHRRHTTEDFVSISTKTHHGKYTYDRSVYKSTKDRVIVTCPMHGDFQQIARVHMRGAGCPRCRSVLISEKGRRTTEQFIADARAKHGDRFDYSKTTYGSRGSDVVTVTCPEHGDFQIAAQQHLYTKYGCPTCAVVGAGASRTRSTDRYISQAKAVHGDTYDYSKTIYTGRFNTITLLCKTHGEFQQSPTSHLTGHGCRQCSVEGSSERYRSSTKEFIDRATMLHGDRYDYSKVVYGQNGQQNVTIICRAHGEFQQTPHNHLTGAGCVTCYRSTAGHHRRLTTEDFVEKVRAIHGDKYSYDKVKYVNTRTKVELVCDKHGSFWTKANSIIANHQGCPRCSYSKGENTIKRVLRRMGIEFIDQYRIPNNRARFRYDFYLPRLRLFIEFQGEQHFRPMGYIGGEDSLLDTQRRDRLKYDLAVSNKYRMVYFDYKQFRLPTVEFEALVAETLSKFKPIINTRKQHDTH